MFILTELRQAPLSYQYHHMLLLNSRRYIEAMTCDPQVCGKNPPPAPPLWLEEESILPMPAGEGAHVDLLWFSGGDPTRADGPSSRA